MFSTEHSVPAQLQHGNSKVRFEPDFAVCRRAFFALIEEPLGQEKQADPSSTPCWEKFFNVRELREVSRRSDTPASVTPGRFSLSRFAVLGVARHRRPGIPWRRCRGFRYAADIFSAR